ncbi:MAG: ribosome-associated translation inhibitor RaiA [Spirochaetaceae bacterium]|jgi:putative sigma-54 modulation protein|nr:ribosome-associated translation inhibitor RaiA [Spirochaetaceae bacterium]GMO26218.1 MAG: HPF/RaiA family ribosome-associated protein [Termitinemataceae bacterium]
MNLDIKALHFTLHDDGREYIEKKLGRLHNAQANIIDLLITLNKDANQFIAEATINFRWGLSSHVKEHETELNAAIDKLFDALSVKITKEKEKVQEKR